MTHPLEELAARVERAEGPDRELDEQIGMGIGLKNTMRIGHDCLGNDRTVPVACPRYTRLLDAAVTLVPFGDSYTVGQNVHHKHWVASINYLGDDGAPHSRSNSYSTVSAPLALVAASLRARAAGEKG